MASPQIVRMPESEFGWRCTEHDLTVGAWPERQAAEGSLAAHIREMHWVAWPSGKREG